MGIGRREFLQGFGAVLAAVATRPSAAVCLFDDIYVNRKLGIGFSKPTGWMFADVHDMGRVKQGQLLALDDSELGRSILDSSDLPLVALNGPAPSADHQIPSAQFYLAAHPAAAEAESRLFSELLHAVFEKEHVESAESSFPPPVQKVRQDWQACRELLAGFLVSSLPKEIEVSRCAAAEYTASYLFEHARLPTPRRVRVRTVAVEHRAMFYLIRLIDSEENAFDFAEFVAGIRLI